jgi:hypothetical protein
MFPTMPGPKGRIVTSGALTIVVAVGWLVLRGPAEPQADPRKLPPTRSFTGLCNRLDPWFATL